MAEPDQKSTQIVPSKAKNQDCNNTLPRDSLSTTSVPSISSNCPTNTAVPTQSGKNSSRILNQQGEGREKFPHNLPKKLNLILGQTGLAYSVFKNDGNHHVYSVGSRVLNNLIREIAQQEGLTLRQHDLKDINHYLQAWAEMSAVKSDVWHRVAPIPDGIEIDLGDEKHTRVRIVAGDVKIVSEGSETLFYKPPTFQPMVLPSDKGDLKRLKGYLNLAPVSELLLLAWVSYTLAHPKIPTSKYVILVLQGSQGSGKTSLCKNIILNLIDPSRVGVQILPKNSKDLAIAAQNAHVLCYDNIRGFSEQMADILCVAATGGSLSSRQLYTDTEQQVLYLHVALVLNGIHSFIDQPDLAQRCLPIELLAIPETQRKSEKELVDELNEDLPAIMRGLFDLIAEVFKYLSQAEVTNPERMIDFVQWIAAMEKVNGVPVGTYQAVYSDALCQGQRESLLDNLLAAEILDFAEKFKGREWSGTPCSLLSELNAQATRGTQRSRDWPRNPIALSKRLAPLHAGLLTQGVSVEFSRGKHRKITITKKGDNYEY